MDSIISFSQKKTFQDNDEFDFAWCHGWDETKSLEYNCPCLYCLLRY